MGIGFAIPMNMARRIVKDIICRGEVVRGWIGVTDTGHRSRYDIPRSMQGVVVLGTKETFTDARRQIQESDGISEVRIDGSTHAMESVDDFLEALVLRGVCGAVITGWGYDRWTTGGRERTCPPNAFLWAMPAIKGTLVGA